MKTTSLLTIALVALGVSTVWAELEKPDQEFVSNAAQGGLAEVQLGQLAQSKASSPKVKEFGAMMVTDHSKANAELKAITDKKSVMLPNDVGPKHQKSMDKLASLSGADFDKAYVKDMLDDHKKDVAEFEKAAKNAKDPEVKAFAAKTLPTLRTHLDHVEALHKEIK